MKPPFFLENASWPAFIMDAAGTVVQANKAGNSSFPELGGNSPKLSSIWAAANSQTPGQFLASCGKNAQPTISLKLRTSSGEAVFTASLAEITRDPEKNFLLQLFPGQLTAASEAKPASDALAQKQKLDCALQLARSVSLDFNNVLTGILGHTSLVLARLEPNHPWRKSLLEVERAAARGAEIANDLGSFSRNETKAPAQTGANLNTVLQRCVDFFRKNPVPESITWAMQLERKLFAARFDDLKIQQAFLRILENAVQAIAGSGRITVQTRNVLLEDATQDRNVRLVPGAYVCAEVIDTGCGIEPDVLPRIFEPFFTTKRGTNHRGLGLAWVYGIITNHGGGVAVSSQPGVGTSVRVYIPAEQRIIHDHHAPVEELNGTQTVLVVDDEDLIVTMAQAILSDHGYKVLIANNGAKALEVLARGQSTVDLVVTDLIMPGMSGRELVEQIQRQHPGMPIICTSGYVWPGNQARDPNFLQKPFAAHDLLRKIKLVLASHAQPQAVGP
jgi:two-component system, cell cycle sensor histidine kinase and response regulator CckA